MSAFGHPAPPAPETTTSQDGARGSLNRRNFLTGVGAVTTIAAGAAVLGCGDSTLPYVDAATQPQVDILNFALNLEYLEATFYSYLVTGKDLDSSLTGGGPAPTGAPAQITFPNAQINDLFAAILFDEMAHVSDLRTALGNRSHRPSAAEPGRACRNDYCLELPAGCAPV